MDANGSIFSPSKYIDMVNSIETEFGSLQYALGLWTLVTWYAAMLEANAF